MNFPLYANDVFEYPTAIALAVIIGFFFGLALEGAGFGRASNLVDQFYGDDMRVLKVMFTAIVTNMVGLGLLGGLGIVDLGALTIPMTWLGPMVVGGLMVGVGFIVSGYCPGTAFVGAGSGHLDAAVTIVGVALGALLFGWTWPWIESFYGSGNLGVLTFVELVGAPWPVLATAVAIMAVGAFLGGEWVERWLAERRGTSAPNLDVGVRNRVFAGFALASVLGLLTLVLPGSSDSETIVQVGDIDAVAFAEQVIAEPQAQWLVDLRRPEDCARERIPGALCVSADDPSADFVADLPRTRPLVVYGDGDLEDLPSVVRDYEGPVTVISGGWQAFERDVLTAPLPPPEATATEVEAYELAFAMHSHFTGSQAQKAPIRAAPKAVKRTRKKGGGC